GWSLAGSRGAIASEEGPACRGHTSGCVRPGVRLGTLDGHHWRHSRAAYRAVAARTNASFVPESFSLDAGAWTGRGRVVLVAGARTADFRTRSAFLYHRAAGFAD